MSATWTSVLDALEQRIADQRAALDVDEPGHVAPFQPPDDLEPLPDALRARAEALLLESRDVEAELAGALTHIRQDLAVLRTVTASTGRPAGARFLDTSL